jgi:hypothetical protein
MSSYPNFTMPYNNPYELLQPKPEPVGTLISLLCCILLILILGGLGVGYIVTNPVKKTIVVTPSVIPETRPPKPKYAIQQY